MTDLRPSERIALAALSRAALIRVKRRPGGFSLPGARRVFAPETITRLARRGLVRVSGDVALPTRPHDGERT